MSLDLTDVAALTVEPAAARLRTGTITVRSDGATRLTMAHLRSGRVTASPGAGTSVVKLAGSEPRGRE
jgi:hypothetical protein